MAVSTPLGPSTTPLVPYVGKNTGVTSLDSLSLAGGMTAGWGVGDGNTSNPPLANGTPFNPYGGNPTFPISRVGILRNVPGFLPAGTNQGSQNALYFLYNPNDIQVSFSIDMSQAPATYTFGDAQNAADQQFTSVGVTNMLNSQTVSWSLLFDRTYDMLYGPDPGGNRGVLKDIGALYLVLGTFVTDAAVPIATPVEVVFGQTDNGDLWGFTGLISGVQIEYGIFRNNMIPSRCTVGLSMTLVYVGAQAPTGGGTGAQTPVSALSSDSSLALPGGSTPIPAPIAGG
jgi:hypothetical protein